MRRSTSVAIAVLAAGCPAKQMGSLVAQGEHHVLRPRGADAPASSPGRPAILLPALDGIGRDLLYEERDYTTYFVMLWLAGCCTGACLPKAEPGCYLCALAARVGASGSLRKLAGSTNPPGTRTLTCM